MIIDCWKCGTFFDVDDQYECPECGACNCDDCLLEAKAKKQSINNKIFKATTK